MATYRSPTLENFAWQPPVDDRVTAPTESEAKGDRYIIIAEASGIFAAKENQLATSKQANPTTADHWYFDTPVEGHRCRVLDENIDYIYSGSAWIAQQALAATDSVIFADIKATQHIYFDAVQTATGDGTTTIDWGLGNKFYFTFGSQNDTFTFTAPDGPCNLVLVLKQDGTGSREATWPESVMWPSGTAPTLTTDGSSIDIISFFYDGTNYFGNSSLNFSVPA